MYTHPQRDGKVDSDPYIFSKFHLMTAGIVGIVELVGLEGPLILLELLGDD